MGSSAAVLVETFARQGYVVVRQLVPAATVAMLCQHLQRRVAEGNLWMGDTQVPNTPGVHGDPVLDELMEQLRPAVEFCTGLRLYPTYSYTRFYKHGDRLPPHRDRAACEISLSLNLDQVPAGPWALNVQGEDGATAALLLPGDVLLYRGIALTHWREPFAGERLTQVFLHYVDQNGPHAAEKFDRRTALGKPLDIKK
jgi:alkylated DNA repair dioxygenase AlkB